MLSQDSLNNDKQKALCSNLKRTIESGNYPKSVLGGNLTEDIDAVLGVHITTDDGCQYNFLTYAIKYDNNGAAADILVFAKTSLNNLLEEQLMVAKRRGKDNLDEPHFLTALGYAQEQANEECERLIVQHADPRRITVRTHEGKSPEDFGTTHFRETNDIPATSPLLQQDVHSQDSETEDYLKDIIIDHINDTKTIHTALTYAISNNDIKKVDDILGINNKNTLKTLLNKEATIQYQDNTERRYTALSYAEAKDLTDLAMKIKRKMHELAPAHEGQSPIGASNRVFEQKISTPVSGHDQQGDDIRSLYAQLDNNIVNGSAQIAKDSLNTLLLHNDEKFQKIVDFKERGMVSLREKIQQKLDDVVHYQGDQELIKILETCVGRINQIDAKLEVPARQNLPPLDEGSPPAPATKPTPATSPLSQPGWHEPLNGTGGFYSRETSISSDSSDDEDDYQSLPETPTFWDKLSANKGKIAMSCNLVAIISFTLGAVFYGSLPAVCTLGTIGIIAAVAAIGIGIKIAYDEIRERAEEDGTNMWEATKSEAKDLLSYMLPSCVKQHKVEKNPTVG